MLFNKTQNKHISKKELVCKTFWQQARGLMFRKRQNVVIIFQKETKISLHMFFVFYPIEVLILNKQQQVVEIKNNFLPFTFWNPQKKGKYILELAEENSKRRTQLGDKISITYKTFR